MISFDFEYYRPTDVAEAVKLFEKLDTENKNPLYYAGGTEIITMARMNQISTGAVIDIKEIPQCNVFEEQENEVAIGAAVTLTRICESNIFPLLSRVLRNSSDHTSRNKITLGGNICGRIPYRESVLPFLICESKVEIAGPRGIRVVNINSAFNETLSLEKGELLIRILTDKEYMGLPFEAMKRTRQERIDYPLVSIAAIKKNKYIRAAFSGVCAFPFRSKEIEECLNNTGLREKQMDTIVSRLSGPVLSNLQGSSAYRKYVLGNILTEIMERMGGE